MKKSPSRGRRAGPSETKELIRKAARERFVNEGYGSSSLRSIAADAGVDVALISYYFGSKRGLFNAAMSLTVNPAEMIEAALEGDLETLPTRMLRGLLALWDDPASAGPLLALLRAAATDPAVGRLTAEAVERGIVIPLAAGIGGEDALRRAASLSAQLSGVILSRYLLRVEPIASMSADEVVDALEPSLARTLSGGAESASRGRRDVAGPKRR
jgi:AcrR family transcriptional regulator